LTPWSWRNVLWESSPTYTKNFETKNDRDKACTRANRRNEEIKRKVGGKAADGPTGLEGKGAGPSGPSTIGEELEAS